jgi:glyoxylase-like metal-dependent hydrolase (beta-lactamase superfamily II)
MKVVSFISSELGTNAYLILSKNPAIIDPGTYANVVIQKLEEYNVKTLEFIILTHYHYDHSQDVLKIKELTKAKVMMHEADFQTLQKRLNEGWYKNLTNFKPDILLEGNETINLGDCILDVIHTPGHSSGSICLYEQKSKSLFSGDTIFPDGGVGRTDILGGNSAELKESVEKLSKLDVKTLYPGHGEITHKEVNEQIRESLEFLNSIEQ